MTDTASMPQEVKDEIKKIEVATKRGFDLQARLKNRGLRRASIVLYLDEEKGAELGGVIEMVTPLGEPAPSQRTGILGEIDLLKEQVATTEALLKAEKPGDPTALDLANKIDLLNLKISDLSEQRDEIVKELTATGITVNVKAVPPIIQKDCHRRAKAALGIETKNIPEDRVEEMAKAETAQLMCAVIQSVTDNATGYVNDELTYEDAIDLLDYLPKSQFARLDEVMGKVQFTDAISRSIESQEDFS